MLMTESYDVSYFESMSLEKYPHHYSASQFHVYNMGKSADFSFHADTSNQAFQAPPTENIEAWYS